MGVSTKEAGITLSKDQYQKAVLLFESEEVDENVLKSLPREPRVKCNVISRYPYLERGPYINAL